MISLETIARALGGEISGGQVRAPGPGHSPKDRSLNIKLDTAAPGGFVVHSFAGDNPILCKDFVRERLGLDRFKANGKSRIIETYDYTDEDGEQLFQVCRFEPKDFRQRRLDGNGGWLWQLGETRRVVYRLPEVLEAASLGKPIFIVEGEKAADALVRLGVTATCSPGGAGKWRSEYGQHLAGAGDVIILPDNDGPGEKHAADIVKAVPSARVLRLPDLPDKGDPFDWIAAGGTAEALWQLVEGLGDDAAEDPKPTDWRAHVVTAGALQTMTFPDPSYVVKGIIPEGLSILAGRPKIGKSWMALDFGLGIASGIPVLGGVDVEQGDVLYCCLEDNYRRLKRRITKLLGAFGGVWPDRLTLATRWRRLDKGGVSDLEAWCDSVSSPRLIILDTLAGVRPTRNGSDTLYEGDYAALRDVHRLANDRAMGALALHHTRKMEADDPVDTISGSLGLAGAADTCLILARNSSGTTLYVRGRDIEECERAVIFGSVNCCWTLLGDAAEVHRSDTRKAILAVLEGATAPMSPQEIVSLTELSRNVVDQRLLNMRDGGEVVQVSRGLYAHPDKEFASARKNRKNVRNGG
jgi:hypothetical protein